MPAKQEAQPTHARSVFKELFVSERSFPILAATILFLFWFAVLVLIRIFSAPATCFAKDEITLLSVFREKFLHADFSSYSFQVGLGISLPRLALTGFGGPLTILFSLLPESVHVQAILFLSAFRLGLAAYFFTRLLTVLLHKKTLPRILLFSLIYTTITFFTSFFLYIPVSGAFSMLPLILFLIREATLHSRPTFSLKLVLACCAYLLTNTLSALLLLPVLIVSLIIFAKKTNDDQSSRMFLRFSAQLLLSLGLCGIFLIPQFLQIPAILKKQDPASSFLQTIGSDTPSHRTEITFSCPVTELFFENKASLVLAGANAGEFSLSDTYADHFVFLNEWIHSVWPYLPTIPFQTATTATTTPEFRDTTHVRFSVSTLFIYPLYASITLPNLSHEVEVLLNDNPTQRISHSRKTVMVYLGTFNVGQNLTLELTSAHPEDLKDVSVNFGYLNSSDWRRYTDSSNFGIQNRELTQDGLYAEAIVAYNSTILTNIPYEKGWSLYLNGTKTAISVYEDALISVPVTAGSYQIFLHYSAPGTIAGGLLSAVSFLLLAAYHYFLSSPKRSSMKSQ